jgi:hypothetical protein
MNYGFDSTTPLWKEDRKQKLADRLHTMVLPLQLADATTAPYVEVDQMYDGVRIRRITNLSEPALKVLVETAEAIYKSVMS